MIIPRFNSNLPEWDKAFVKWYGVAGMNIRDAMRTQGRLLFERLIHWRGGAIATPPKSQAQGKRAVKRDIYRAVFPMRAEGFGNPKIRKRVREAVDEKDYVSLQEMLKRGVFGKNLKSAHVFKFAAKLHRSMRRSRGRVPRSTKYVYATPDTDEMKAYVERTQKMVGQGKGGWAASLIRLGGKAASWFGRHVGAGRFIDNLDRRSRPEFIGINQSAWASGGDVDRIMGMAMEGRAMAMTKDIERRLEASWKGAR